MSMMKQVSPGTRELMGRIVALCAVSGLEVKVCAEALACALGSGCYFAGHDGAALERMLELSRAAYADAEEFGPHQ